MNSLLALKQRAQCYMAKERYDQARSDLDLLLSIDPDNFEVQVSIHDHRAYLHHWYFFRS